MDVTVILCTYNRAESLPVALESVATQSVPGEIRWEVVVVDNNSSDRTSEVVEDYTQKFPGRIRYAFEPEQGLSRARNTGVRMARGRIIAFIDDDVIADPSWLANLTGPLLSGECAGSGGRILPPKGFHPPKWMKIGGKHDLFGSLLPLFDLGDWATEMTRPPLGANMAFRKEMFGRYGAFRTDLGRCGNNYLMGEEIDFGNRLLSGGETLRYEPTAVVHHPVQEQRLSRKFYRRWWFDFGRTRIIERPRRGGALGIPREYVSILSQVVRRLPVNVIGWMIAFDEGSRFYYECQMWSVWGEIVENYRCTIVPARVSAVPIESEKRS